MHTLLGNTHPVGLVAFMAVLETQTGSDRLDHLTTFGSRDGTTTRQNAIRRFIWILEFLGKCQINIRLCVDDFPEHLGTSRRLSKASLVMLIIDWCAHLDAIIFAVRRGDSIDLAVARHKNLALGK